jgi:pyruvate/2-oxoglutarate dehydrogenase complex dihydrolipoamide dehydrogenase (E3) component
MVTSPRRTARILTAEQAATRVWDLVVIGAGSAGLVGAKTAAHLGARVLIVEAHRFGGECLHTGCVPSKALIAAASAAHAAREGGELGVSATVRVDFPAVMAHVRRAIAAIAPVDGPDALAGEGVFSVQGRATFAAPRTVVVDGRAIRFRDALVATGSSPRLPDAPGVGAVDVLTNETFWDLDEQPARLLVNGGGAVGCEIAQAMARLGSTVTVVHRGERLLEKEEPRASAIVLDALRADGVDVRLGVSVTEWAGEEGSTGPTAGGLARLSDGGEVRFDRVLAALGRRVDTSGLGLDAAGVRLDDSGAIVVDRTMRTSNPRIRAAGDTTPLPRFTHTAGMYASVAATNAVLGLRRAIDSDAVPRVTFTAPEVAAVGVAPADAADRGLRVVVQPNRDVDRAIADGRTEGYTAVVLDRRSRVRGAVVVGPRAGEALAELTVATRLGLTAGALAGTIHAYPTYSDAGWSAVVADTRRALSGGAVGLAIRLLRVIRRRRD